MLILNVAQDDLLRRIRRRWLFSLPAQDLAEPETWLTSEPAVQPRLLPLNRIVEVISYPGLIYHLVKAFGNGQVRTTSLQIATAT